MLVNVLAVSTLHLRVCGARTHLWRRRLSSLLFDSGISNGFAFSRSSSCSSSEGCPGDRPCSDVEKGNPGPTSRRSFVSIATWSPRVSWHILFLCVLLSKIANMSPAPSSLLLVSVATTYIPTHLRTPSFSHSIYLVCCDQSPSACYSSGVISRVS